MNKSRASFPIPPRKALTICAGIAGSVAGVAVLRRLTGVDILPALEDGEIIGMLCGMAAGVIVWTGIIWWRDRRSDRGGA